MKVALPYRGEFGHKVMWHAPQVYAHGNIDLALIEWGTESLYPLADRYTYVDTLDESKRRGKMSGDREVLQQLKHRYRGSDLIWPSPNAPRRYFQPVPSQKMPIPPVDVVVCPRKREYGKRRNWPQWHDLIRALEHRGLNVFAAGVADSSYDVDCPRAWNYDRPLDASLTAFHAARMVVATDSGLAHLAVACGRPLALVLAKDRRVAPNAIPSNLPRMLRGNHLGAPVTPLERAWEEPERVYEFVIERMSR